MKSNIKRYELTVLVENHAGVLSRVATLFSRRGYNIDSINAGITSNPKQSSMVIVVRGDKAILEQIIKQLSKLIEVISIDYSEFSDTEMPDSE